MSHEAERDSRMALACVTEPGRHRLAEEVQRRGAEAVWRQIQERTSATGLRLRPADVDLRAVQQETQRAGARFVIPGDREWFTGLDDLAMLDQVGDTWSAPPLGLWIVGPADLSQASSRAVAVVGSRACTSYGETVATELAADLAERDVTVVSGAAYGIDAAAHRGALAVNGTTVAVLACGIDRDYPQGNAGLLRHIRATGAVITEHPPGTIVNRSRFLARNRLIAALAQGTVMVESATRSGARNTVTWTDSLSRRVFAVPGPVTSTMSAGPHSLIRDFNAILVRNGSDICADLGLVPEPAYQPEPATPFDLLTAEQQMVRELLPARGQVSTDELVIRSGLGVQQCLVALQGLVDQDMVTAASEGMWRLRPH